MRLHLLKQTVELWDTLMAINTRSVLILTQEYARARIAAGKGGAVVNVSSMSAFTGFISRFSSVNQR